MRDMISDLDGAFRMGRAHHEAGRIADAERIYRDILSRQPNHAGSLHQLGLIAAWTGHLQDGANLIERAVSLAPYSPAPWIDLGAVFAELGRVAEAEDAYRRAAALDPASALAWIGLGCLLAQSRRAAEAVTAFREAVAADPNCAPAYGNLGNALLEVGDAAAAVAAHRRAVELAPHVADTHSNLGNSLWESGDCEAAAAACRRAVALNPNMPLAHVNLGNALKDMDRLDEAIAAYRQAIALAPNLPLAHYNLAFALLAAGRFHEGWEEYEWRWAYDRFPSRPRGFRQPLWNGEPFADRTILIHFEQGFGDCLQFIRYLPDVAERGRSILVECPEPLVRLLEPSLPTNASMVVVGESLPTFDLHCPLLSVPRALKATIASRSDRMPYLRVSDTIAARWRQRLLPYDDRPRIGLVWAGRPTHANDRNRSVSLAALAPLAAVPGVCFVGLQTGPAAAQARTPPEGMTFVDLSEELTDFADTAGAMASLDLVVTVDTAAAHLAGGLGKPVWTLLPCRGTDWRWFHGRDASPWYPTMRLFRQSAPGDWDGVVRRVGGELTQWLGIKGSES